jgi:hypothetical protein
MDYKAFKSLSQCIQNRLGPNVDIASATQGMKKFGEELWEKFWRQDILSNFRIISCQLSLRTAHNESMALLGTISSVSSLGMGRT